MSRNSAIIDRRNFLFNTVKRIQIILNSFYSMPELSEKKLFTGVRVPVRVDLDSMKAYWSVGMNTINIALTNKTVFLFVNGTEQATFPFTGKMGNKKREEILNLLKNVCEQSPN